MKKMVRTPAAPARRKLSLARRTAMLSAIVGAVSLLASAPAAAANKARLSVYQHGKEVGYLPCGAYPLPKRTAVLMGGGLDVKEAYSWMIARMAECGDGLSGRPGNFVVIRAGGNPAYDSFIYKLGPLAAVQTLVVPNADAANDTALEPYIRNAGAIWLTGGDQGDYYNFWKGTLLERLISEQVKNFAIPIGGTSAGMMILSEFAYIAYPNTIVSQDALNDPFKEGSVTLKRDFWTNRTPFLPLLSTVTDSHFDTRNRMGRLVTFLARTIGDGWVSTQNARAIGVDQETALLMEYPDKAAPGQSSYRVSTVSNPGVDGAGYVLNAGSGSELVLTPGLPLTFTRVQVHKLPAISAPSSYEINVVGGTISSTSGSLY